MGWLSLIDGVYGIEIGIRKEHKLDKYRRKVITYKLYSKVTFGSAIEKVFKVKLTKVYTWCIDEIESRTINIEREE